MPGIANEMVSVPLGQETITGLLFGNESLWSFESAEPSFLKHFPAGVAYSFNDYGLGEDFQSNRDFQSVVWEKLGTILNEKAALQAT